MGRTKCMCEGLFFGTISTLDIIRWEREHDLMGKDRGEIFGRAQGSWVEDLVTGEVSGGGYWVDLSSRSPEIRCPWYRVEGETCWCKIEETKPLACRAEGHRATYDVTPGLPETWRNLWETDLP